MRVRAAGILTREEGILLVKHEKRGMGYWLLPGGGIGVGERAADALGRELREELNLECEVLSMLFVVEVLNSRGDHLLQPTFEVRAKSVGEIRTGGDKRVTEWNFFDARGMDFIKVYPDIKEELREYLSDGKVSRRYIRKGWID